MRDKAVCILDIAHAKIIKRMVCRTAVPLGIQGGAEPPWREPEGRALR